MEEQLGTLPLIAEDLGSITPEVEALRDRFDFPGMKILQFAFGGERNSDFLPHNFTQTALSTRARMIMNQTGWFQNASDDERDHIRRYMAIDGRNIAWDMIRLAYASVANTAAATFTRRMEPDNVARMNFPASPAATGSGVTHPTGSPTKSPIAYGISLYSPLPFTHNRLSHAPSCRHQHWPGSGKKRYDLGLREIGRSGGTNRNRPGWSDQLMRSFASNMRQ